MLPAAPATTASLTKVTNTHYWELGETENGQSKEPYERFLDERTRSTDASGTLDARIQKAGGTNSHLEELNPSLCAQVYAYW